MTMKKLLCTTFATALFVLLSSLSSRGKITPEKPINQAKERGHEVPYSTDFIFTPCEVADTTALFVDKITNKGASFTWSFSNEKANHTPLALKRGQWYHLEIVLRNASGSDINAQYITPEQAALHQFFFISRELKDEAKKTYRTIPSAITYKYAETLQLEGKRNPIGLEGAFYVHPNATPDHFFLNVVLVHVLPPSTKINRTTNSFYPFDQPARTMGTRDLELYIPIDLQ